MTRKISLIGPVNPEGLDEIAEKLLNENDSYSARLETKGRCLENYRDFWRLHGVEYDGKIIYMDLKKNPLSNGILKTQDELAEYSRKAIEKNQFHASSLPMYYAFFATLFVNRNNESKEEIEKIRAFVEKNIKKGAVTLTRIVYKSSGEDKAMHDFGLPEQHEISGNFAGRAEMVKRSSDDRLCKALFGTEDIMEIYSVYKWLTGKNVCIQRIPKKKKATTVHAAKLCLYHGLAVINCSSGLNSKSIALGIRIEDL